MTFMVKVCPYYIIIVFFQKIESELMNRFPIIISQG